VLAPSLPLKQWFPTFFGPWTIFSKNIPCGPLCITRDSRRTTNTKAKDSVVQLLLNYGTIYKNVTTRGPLPIKWCIKQQIRKIQHCKGTVKWVRHRNHYTISINNLLQISISAMPVAEASLTLSFLYQYQYVRDSKSEIMLWCCVCHSVFVFRFDLLHRRKSSPNIECIFSAKSFSLWNLSQLTNL